MAMTLDERIKTFTRTFSRPTEWDSAWKIMIKLCYDLIDDREDLKTMLARKDARINVLTVASAAAMMVADERGGITEEEERASKDRVLARYDKYPG